MIYVAVLFTEDIPEQLVLPSDAAAIERIEAAKCADVRKDRIWSYTLLERAFFDIFLKPMPPLCFDTCGKPSLVGSEIKISVSHTGGVCAVAFSDCNVGIDVQSYDEMCGKERVLQRFVNETLQNLIKSTKKPKVNYLVYKANKSGIMLINGARRDLFVGKYNKGKEQNAAALWSALEAVLKCRGGFCEYKNAETLLQASRIDTHYLHNAAISVAVIK